MITCVTASTSPVVFTMLTHAWIVMPVTTSAVMMHTAAANIQVCKKNPMLDNLISYSQSIFSLSLGWSVEIQKLM